jgi:HAD superfamily hydrolase (TIGR01548 family)
MATLQVDAILFDIDGTLVDESQSYREAIRRTAEFLLHRPVEMHEVDAVKSIPGFNNDWDATWALVGRRIHGSLYRADAADRGSQAYRRLRNIFQTYYLGHSVWAQLSGEEPPFVWEEPLMATERPLIELESLERLRGFMLGIVTSRPRAEALMALTQHGFDRYFPADRVIAMEDAAREKPHPEPLQAMVRRLGCTAPVYVGDTINDALAAAAAGVPFVHAGKARLAQRARHHIEDVNEICSLCAPLQAVTS